MSRKVIGFSLVALGDLVLVVSLAADALGLGGAPGIGWKQILGACIGILIQVVGLIMTQVESTKSGGK